jgi:23S rRNA pseudouridine1911/1915/1917 synthase
MDPTERLDVRVMREFAVSRRKAHDIIAAGQVDVDGACVRDAAQRVDSVRLVSYQPNRKKQEAIRLSLPTAYFDDHLVVVDKPAGLLSVPTDASSRDDCVLNRLRDDLRHTRGSRAYVGALHRLDRGTSGLIAMALSRECHAAGRAAFREHAFLRRYLAIVEGVPRPAQGTIDLPIADEYESGKRHVAHDDEEPSRDAITHYRVRERFARSALVEIELDTGRQHQIRLHLRALGNPIVGDAVYGSSKASSGNRPLLHASELSFPHPITGAPVECASDPPADFEAALRRLRGLSKGR